MDIKDVIKKSFLLIKSPPFFRSLAPPNSKYFQYYYIILIYSKLTYLVYFFLFFILFSMYSREVEEKLKQIKIEDFIWVIYIGIIALSYYSNYLERKYYLNNDMESKNKYRSIMILIFSILIIVYFYFLKDSYDSFKDLNEFDTKKKKRLVYLSFLASLLIFISGLLFLYISISDTDLNVELAFN